MKKSIGRVVYWYEGTAALINMSDVYGLSNKR